jgi:hypothetical protein
MSSASSFNPLHVRYMGLAQRVLTHSGPWTRALGFGGRIPPDRGLSRTSGHHRIPTANRRLSE